MLQEIPALLFQFHSYALSLSLPTIRSASISGNCACTRNTRKPSRSATAPDRKTLQTHSSAQIPVPRNVSAHRTWAGPAWFAQTVLRTLGAWRLWFACIMNQIQHIFPLFRQPAPLGKSFQSARHKVPAHKPCFERTHAVLAQLSIFLHRRQFLQRLATRAQSWNKFSISTFLLPKLFPACIRAKLV